MAVGDGALNGNELQKQEIDATQQVDIGAHNVKVAENNNHVPDGKDSNTAAEAGIVDRNEQRDPEKGAEPNDGRTIGFANQVEEPARADENEVWWNDDDPENPHNWSSWSKVLNVGFISALNFLTPLSSAMIAPGVSQLMQEFGADNNLELATFVVSVYVLGFAAGPLAIAPLSEIYGRLIVYHACNIGFVAFTVACALAPSLASLVAFRFLSGVFGSCPVSNGAGTIADLIAQEKRGAAVAIYSIGPLLGPIIGPVAGGFLAGAMGWRWVFWVLAIVVGALAIAMVIFARETYAPVLLQRRTDRLRKETGNESLRSRLDSGLSHRAYFGRSIVRPLRLLAFSPLCTAYSTLVAIAYGYLYIMFTTISPVFAEFYPFTTSTVGLVFFGLGVGSLLGLMYYSHTSDRALKSRSEEDGQGMKPEYRLLPLPYGTALVPAGLFVYGWTAQYHIHWIVPILSHVLM